MHRKKTQVELTKRIVADRNDLNGQVIFNGPLVDDVDLEDMGDKMQMAL